MSDLRPLTSEEETALRDYARRQGRTWKSKLNFAWTKAEAELGPLIHGLRNSHGPSWLVRYRLPEDPA